jgi:hypothetical protein
MTKRKCPWCGGENLTLTECSGQDPKRQFSSYQHWHDRECGYSEKTSGTEYYDYRESKFVECEREIISFHKPRAPLPAHQQPAYLRYGLHKPEPVEVEQGQQVLGGVPA